MFPAFVWHHPERDAVAPLELAPRSRRSILSAKIPCIELPSADGDAASEFLQWSAGPCVLLQAGAWFADERRISPPPPSATGQPVCAIGQSARHRADRDSSKMAEAPRLTAGGSERVPQPATGPADPPIACGLDHLGAVRLQFLVRQHKSWIAGLRALIRDSTVRVVPFPPLNAWFDAGLRVLQVVTSLQRGGAERITLDLTRALDRLGVFVAVASLGRPTRGAFPAPPRHLDLAAHAPRREDRIPALERGAVRLGIDLIHAHLIDRADAAALTARGWPLAMTIHNTSAGWPDGLAALQSTEATVLLSCAQNVEAELRRANVPVPVRTVWNGIDADSCVCRAGWRERRARWRGEHAIPEQAVVLLAVANPRPQKRMHRLPGIASAVQSLLRSRGIQRPVHLVLAGEASRSSAAAADSLEQIQTEVRRFGWEARTHWLGSVDPVAPLFEAADVLVSTSAHEGLSLAQLEALAAGLPVMATDVGGTREVARRTTHLRLVDSETNATAVAQALFEQLENVVAVGDSTCAAAAGPSLRKNDSLADRPSALPSDFHLMTMARRYRQLYPRVVATRERRDSGTGLWLVTNNFSMGGAQSSARRLLTELHRRGIRVRATVLQEQVEYPTPGRRALESAGIPVQGLAGDLQSDPAERLNPLLRAMERDPPQAVLLWNALAEYKLLLADSLWTTPVFDVSPGEMYFDSLQRYFTRPRSGLPITTPCEYGARLAGIIVKFAAEETTAAQLLGAPVHVIPNGVPLPEATRSRDLLPAGSPLVIGTAARISPQKRLEDLLAAIRIAQPRLGPFVLRVAGGVEPDTREYADRLRELGAGLPVEWLGKLPDTSQFLNTLDLFAMISAPAGCPNASLEAMAAGLPVVATDWGGAADQILHRQTGLLVPADDPAGLAEHLVELAHSPVLREQLSRGARDHVERHFSVGRMADDYCRACLSAK